MNMAESECNGVSAAASNLNNHRSDSTDSVDYISSLPDAVVHHILSFIPTKFVIRSSVLSKRWKHMWKTSPSISFDCSREDLCSINKALSSYSAPKIMSFDLNISGDDVTSPQIDVWIEFAMSRNAEKWSLVFKSKDDYRFQDSFYVNSSAKQLSVTLGFSDMIPTYNVSWTSLRNLSLSCCKLTDKSIDNILSGCSMLESLILNLCQNVHHLDLSKSLNLRRLEIFGNHWIQGPAKIVAPHIRYLSLKNSQRPCTFVDVSSLTEANLNLASGNLEFGFLQGMVLKMLTKLQNIEKLTIGVVILQVLSLAALRGVSFPQLKIKVLTIETMVVQSVIPGIAKLLQNSPGLKKITVYTMKCKAILDKELDRYLNTQDLNPNTCWSVVFPRVDQEQTSSMFCKDAKAKKHVTSFRERVLRNTNTLETMVLRLGRYLNATEFQDSFSEQQEGKKLRPSDLKQFHNYSINF